MIKRFLLWLLASVLGVNFKQKQAQKKVIKEILETPTVTRKTVKDYVKPSFTTARALPEEEKFVCLLNGVVETAVESTVSESKEDGKPKLTVVAPAVEIMESTNKGRGKRKTLVPQKPDFESILEGEFDRDHVAFAYQTYLSRKRKVEITERQEAFVGWKASQDRYEQLKEILDSPKVSKQDMYHELVTEVHGVFSISTTDELLERYKPRHGLRLVT